MCQLYADFLLWWTLCSPLVKVLDFCVYYIPFDYICQAIFDFRRMPNRAVLLPKSKSTALDMDTLRQRLTGLPVSRCL